MHIFEFNIFGIQIVPTWYWLMYALGFIICYRFMLKNWKYRDQDIDTLLYFVFCWVLLWGRIWYVLLYNLEYFISHPYDIFSFWKWWMSFHGGFIGVLIGVWIFGRWKKYSFFEITDILAVIMPIALWLGRIGNLINQELLGFSPYIGPFAVRIGEMSYFPSPLLEAILEWAILFFVMIFFWKFQKSSKNPPYRYGFLSSIFLIGYSIARLISEQFRLPDAHIGYLFGSDWISLGILYTLPMILFGIILLLKSTR